MKRKAFCTGTQGLSVVLLACLMLAWGCSSGHHSGHRGQHMSFSVPPQTSDPLNATELAVLNSKQGRVDKDVPYEARADVEQHYRYYLRNGRKTMDIISRRSEQYLAYVQQVFRSRGMPEELAYLALVESGYKSDAQSPAGAAGTWQFLPRTGRYFGLAQDEWLDERLDTYRATEAAADYLQKLYGYFGNWPTAIAAYNAGEGKIKRAMEATGGRDFFEVKNRNHRLDYEARLRDETKQYVPRFLAMTKIMNNLPKLGFAPIHPQSAVPMTRVSVRPGTDLRAFSSACRLDWDSFKEHNQHHKYRVTSTRQTTYVYVPTPYVQAAQAFLSSPQASPYSGWQVATVGNSRESWEKISRRSQVPVSTLRAANPHISRLRAGNKVLLPPAALSQQTRLAARENDERRSSGRTTAAKQGKNYASVSRESGKARIHCLQPNETLYSVARRYAVTLQALKEHNNIANPDMVRAGATLRIPQAAADTRARSGAGKAKRSYYTVQANDSLWNIARKYKVSVDDLKRWNKVEASSLRPGVRLVVALD